MNTLQEIPILLSDTNMDDCDSDSSTEELDQEEIQSEENNESLFHPSTTTEAHSQFPLRQRAPSFSMGQTALVMKGPFARHHEDKRRNRTLRKKITHASFDRTAKSMASPLASSTDGITMASLFSVEREKIQRARTLSKSDDFFGLQPFPTPSSPYKPPKEIAEKKLRSNSVSALRSQSNHQYNRAELEIPAFIPPGNLNSLESKENEENSSNFARAEKPKSEGNSTFCIGIRRTVSDMGSSYVRKLPFTKKKLCDYITVHTVYDLLNGKYNQSFDEILIIDCRYTYEYEGGHIPGAISMLPAERDTRLKEWFFSPAVPCERKAIVFHCEFSSKRGPESWRQLRDLDRKYNGRFDELYYPEIYVMEGGYQNFYQAYPHVCEGRYIEMKDKRFKGEYNQNIKREKEVRRSGSFVAPNRRLLSRSQTSLSFSNHF